MNIFSNNLIYHTDQNKTLAWGLEYVKILIKIYFQSRFQLYHSMMLQFYDYSDKNVLIARLIDNVNRNKKNYALDIILLNGLS